MRLYEELKDQSINYQINNKFLTNFCFNMKNSKHYDNLIITISN